MRVTPEVVEELRQMIRNAAELNEKWFREEGDIKNGYVWIHEDGRSTFVAELITGDDEKEYEAGVDLVTTGMRIQMQEQKVTRYCHWMEAWFLEAHEPSKEKIREIQDVRPRHHAEKRECLYYSAAVRGFEISARQEIFRDPTRLGLLEFTDLGDGTTVGRWARMLDRFGPDNMPALRALQSAMQQAEKKGK